MLPCFDGQQHQAALRTRRRRDTRAPAPSRRSRRRSPAVKRSRRPGARSQDDRAVVEPVREAPLIRSSPSRGSHGRRAGVRAPARPGAARRSRQHCQARAAAQVWRARRRTASGASAAGGASEVVAASVGRRRMAARLTPMPTRPSHSRPAPSPASTRMPASFAPSISTSLGHFSCERGGAASRPATASHDRQRGDEATSWRPRPAGPSGAQQQGARRGCPSRRPGAAPAAAAGGLPPAVIQTRPRARRGRAGARVGVGGARQRMRAGRERKPDGGAAQPPRPRRAPRPPPGRRQQRPRHDRRTAPSSSARAYGDGHAPRAAAGRSRRPARRTTSP